MELGYGTCMQCMLLQHKLVFVKPIVYLTGFFVIHGQLYIELSSFV